MFLFFYKRKPYRLWCPVEWETNGRYLGPKFRTREAAVEFGFMHVDTCPVTHEVDYV